MSLTVDTKRFSAGHVVYFDHVHNDVPLEVVGSDKHGEYYVRVEGKPRRMLILGCCFRVHLETVKDTKKRRGVGDEIYVYEAKAREGYVVVSLRSRPSPLRQGDFLNLGKGFLKGFLDEERETWMSREVYIYDVTNVCHTGKAEKKDDRMVARIKELLAFKRLGWHRA